MLKAILEENYDENYLCTDKAQVLSKSISFPRFYFVTKVAIRGYNTVNLSLLQFYYNLYGDEVSCIISLLLHFKKNVLT